MLKSDFLSTHGRWIKKYKSLKLKDTQKYYKNRFKISIIC
nr:MAG TPA: hypothetical protein [Caudoviricetes sp.]